MIYTNNKNYINDSKIISTTQKIKINLILFFVLIIGYIFNFDNTLVVLAAPESNTFVVTDLGANGNDKEDDTDAINTVLKKAILTSPITVTIPAGTYYISNTLKIYSNTTLILEEGAVIIASDEKLGTMLRSYHLNDNKKSCSPEEKCTHGGYSQAHDIIVEGGIWDRNDTGKASNGILRFNHANNITIRNTTLKKCTDHFVNVSGSSNVLIENVTVTDAVVCNDDAKEYWGNFKPGEQARLNILEAIHIDYSSSSGEHVGFPMDNTPPNNITIKNCTFNNVWCGIGSHHIYDSQMPSSITITDNKFTNISAYAINSYSYTDMIISNNTVDSGFGLVRSKASTTTITNNTMTNNTQNIISISDNSISTVNNNSITNTKSDGSALRIDSGSSLTATNNTISDIGSYAVYATNNSVADLNSNTISNVKITGIRSKNSTVKSQNNTISNIETHGFSCTDNSTLTSKNDTIISVKENGFYLNDKSYATIDGCTINDTGIAGIYANRSLVYASNNNIDNAADSGILGKEQASINANNNNLRNCDIGINLSNNKSSVIANNKFNSIKNIGIKVEKSPNTRIIKNNLATITAPNIKVTESANIFVVKNIINTINDTCITITDCDNYTREKNHIEAIKINVNDNIISILNSHKIIKYIYSLLYYILHQ